MANALKSAPEVDLPMPTGIVVRAGAGQRGGDEYYYQEFQNTNPDIKINNRGSVPVAPDTSSAPAADAATQADTPPPADAVENVKDQLF